MRSSSEWTVLDPNVIGVIGRAELDQGFLFHWFQTAATGSTVAPRPRARGRQRGSPARRKRGGAFHVAEHRDDLAVRSQLQSRRAGAQRAVPPSEPVGRPPTLPRFYAMPDGSALNPCRSVPAILQRIPRRNEERVGGWLPSGRAKSSLHPSPARHLRSGRERDPIEPDHLPARSGSRDNEDVGRDRNLVRFHGYRSTTLRCVPERHGSRGVVYCSPFLYARVGGTPNRDVSRSGSGRSPENHNVANPRGKLSRVSVVRLEISDVFAVVLIIEHRPVIVNDNAFGRTKLLPRLIP